VILLEDFDKIEKNLNIHLSNIQGYIRDTFNLSSREQKTIFRFSNRRFIRKAQKTHKDTDNFLVNGG
jgi:hypothetical protein